MTTTAGTAPLTFLEYFQDNNNDKYDGDYAEPFSAFRVPTAVVNYDPAAIHAMVGALEDAPHAFAGLFPYPHEDAGRVRLFIAPKLLPRTLGPVSPLAGQTWAFLGDVTTGAITTVRFPDNAFELSPNNPITTTTFGPDLLKDMETTDVQLVGPYNPGDTGTTTIHFPRMTWVPHVLVPHLIGRETAPRDFLKLVLNHVTTNTLSNQWSPICKFALGIVTKVNAADTHSPLKCTTDLAAPVGDARFHQFRQKELCKHSPALSTVPAGGPTDRIADAMGDLLLAQQAANLDAANARARASAPKTPSECFKTFLVARLLDLCDVTVETNLPELWKTIAATNGKREREAIDAKVREVASLLGFQHVVPVITPDLAKKLTTVRLAGSNMGDLTEGINPFLMIIPDYSSPGGEQTHLDAVAMAHDCDDLVAGNAAAKMDDIKSMKAGSKIQIPYSYPAARAMLSAYLIIIKAILGDAHDVSVELQNFLAQYTAKENFYMGRIVRVDGIHGPARILRFVQLRHRAWFAAHETATTAAARALITTPTLMEGLNKMEIGDVTWLPEIPVSYRPSTKPVTQPLDYPPSYPTP